VYGGTEEDLFCYSDTLGMRLADQLSSDKARGEAGTKAVGGSFYRTDSPAIEARRYIVTKTSNGSEVVSMERYGQKRARGVPNASVGRLTANRETAQSRLQKHDPYEK